MKPHTYDKKKAKILLTLCTSNMLIGLIYWFELSNNILILLGYGEELAYLECLMAGNKSTSPPAHKTHP
jgi:hypothetical protein